MSLNANPRSLPGLPDRINWPHCVRIILACLRVALSARELTQFPISGVRIKQKKKYTIVLVALVACANDGGAVVSGVILLRFLLRSFWHSQCGKDNTRHAAWVFVCTFCTLYASLSASI